MTFIGDLHFSAYKQSQTSLQLKNSTPPPKSRLSSVVDDDFKVYCPVCNYDYLNSQAYEHLQKHQLTESYYFNNDKDLATTMVSSRPTPSRTMYPLVEPLEFYTTELYDAKHRDTFIVEKEENNKQDQKVVEVKTVTTQTPSRNMQIRNNESDLYNCFDNLFSSQPFSASRDLVSNNVGLASKKNLN